MVEFRRVEDTADQNEQLLAHLSEHLSHFLTARLKTMELYPFLYDHRKKKGHITVIQLGTVLRTLAHLFLKLS